MPLSRSQCGMEERRKLSLSRLKSRQAGIIQTPRTTLRRLFTRSYYLIDMVSVYEIHQPKPRLTDSQTSILPMAYSTISKRLKYHEFLQYAMSFSI